MPASALGVTSSSSSSLSPPAAGYTHTGPPAAGYTHTSIALLLRNMSSSNLNHHISKLKYLATTSDEPLQLNELALLAPSLAPLIPGMSCYQVADALWSAGTKAQMTLLASPRPPFNPHRAPASQYLQELSTTLSPLAIHRLLELGREMPPTLVARLGRSVAMTLTGMVRMNASYALLGDATRSELHALVLLAIPGLTGQQGRSLASTVWALGRLGMPLAPGGAASALLPPLIAQCLAEFESSPSTDHTLSSLLVGLHAAGVTWPDLPVPLQSTLSRSFCRVCTKISSRALGNTLWSLGKMGFVHAAMTDRVTMATELGVRAAAGKMRKSDAVQIVQGLAAVRFKWSFLSLETREMLAGSVYTSLAAQWAAQGENCLVPMATLFFSLARLGARWGDVEKHRGLRAALLVGIKAAAAGAQEEDEADRRVKRGAQRLTAAAAAAAKAAATRATAARQASKTGAQSDPSALARGTASLLYSLSLLEAPLHTLPAPTRLAVFAVLKRRLSASLGGDIGEEETEEGHKEEVEEAEEHGNGSMTGLALSLSVYSLGQLGARLDSLPQPTAQLVLKAVERELAVLLRGPPSAIKLVDACNLLHGLGMLTGAGNRGQATMGPSLASRISNRRRGSSEGSVVSMSRSLAGRVVDILSAMLRGLLQESEGAGFEVESSFVERCVVLLRACDSLGVSWAEIGDAEAARALLCAVALEGSLAGVGAREQEEAQEGSLQEDWRGGAEGDYRPFLVLRGLSLLGMEAAELGTQCMSSFITTLCGAGPRALGPLNPHTLSMLLQALARMHTSAAWLSLPARQALLRNFYAIGTGGWMTSKDGGMRARPASDRHDTSSPDFHEVTSRGCCMILYSLGRMGFTFSELNHAGYLVDTLVSLLPSHTPRRLPITLIALYYLRIPAWARLPSSLHLALCSAVAAAADRTWAEDSKAEGEEDASARLTSQGAACVLKLVRHVLAEEAEAMPASESPGALSTLLRVQLRQSAIRMVGNFLPEGGASVAWAPGEDDLDENGELDGEGDGEERLYGTIFQALDGALEPVVASAAPGYSRYEGREVERILVELGWIDELVPSQRQALRRMAWTDHSYISGSAAGAGPGGGGFVDVTAQLFDVRMQEDGEEEVVPHPTSPQDRNSGSNGGAGGVGAEQQTEVSAGRVAQALRQGLGVDWAWASEQQRREGVLLLADLLGGPQGGAGTEAVMTVLHALRLLELTWADLPTRPRNVLGASMARELLAGHGACGGGGSVPVGHLQRAVARVGMRRHEIPRQLRDALDVMGVRL